MYQALYRKWRPLCFADVIGQKHITDTLKSEVATGHLSHAYLFTGTRGTGKTTCAKILARAVNCEHPNQGDPCNECPACRGILDGSVMDVVEIDAASNNGVDNIRDIRDEVQYTPAAVRKRVYIIDEVHMLSSGAFNALLKTLEEPPEHVLFILATTEIHKVPATILSRCQRFDFRRIAPEDIAERLLTVAKNEDIPLTQPGAALIARLADGAMRDALSILDRTSAGGQTVDEESISRAVGILGGQHTRTLMRAILQGALDQAMGVIEECYTMGRDLAAVLNQLLGLIRDMLLFKSAKGNITAILSHPQETVEELANQCDAGTLIAYTHVLQDSMSRMRNAASRRVEAELAVIRLCTLTADDYDSIEQRVGALEEKVRHGVPMVSAAPTAPAEVPAIQATQTTAEKPVREAAAAVQIQPGKRKAAKPKYWTEWPQLLDRLSTKINTGAYVNLKLSARALLEGNTLHLLTDDSVTAQLAAATKTRDIIAEEASAILGNVCVVKIEELEEEAEPTDTAAVDSAIDSARAFGVPVTEL